MHIVDDDGMAQAPSKRGAKKAAAKRPAAKKAAAKRPAAKRPAAKRSAAKKPARPRKQTARSRGSAAPIANAGVAPQPTRFAFEALPVLRDPADLTPLLRRQLVVDVLLELGRTTTPDRIPTSYFAIGVHRWRVTDGGVPQFEVVQNTAFFIDTDEPLGLERVQGCWEATGRYAARGRALDLHHLAWEFNRDWPGRRLPLDPEPKRNKPLNVDEGLRDQPWPADATFV